MPCSQVTVTPADDGGNGGNGGGGRALVLGLAALGLGAVVVGGGRNAN